MTLRYPAFFDLVPRPRLRDPLAAFLGAAQDGLLEYSYLDAVKLAGHSCPTVAAAYGLAARALAALYGDGLPERGRIRIEMREARDAGVAGVIASVMSLLTGAAAETGFKGIGGAFVRRDLLRFGADVPLEVRFTRIDSGAAIDAAAYIQRVPADPALPALLQRRLSGAATPDEAQRFGELWQERVRRILLDQSEDPQVFLLRRAP